MITDEEFARRFAAMEIAARAPCDNVTWTTHLSSTAALLGAELDLYVTTKAMPNGFGRSEYLALDAVMLEKGHPEHATGFGRASFPLPAVTMEFENLPAKLHFDFWKLLCVRSRLRVFAFVVRRENDIPVAVEKLTLMRGEHPQLDGQDLLLVGLFNMSTGTTPWSVFVWRDGRFVQPDAPAGATGWRATT